MEIQIRKSPTADSRSGGTNITVDELYESTKMHQEDIKSGLANLSAILLRKAALN